MADGSTIYSLRAGDVYLCPQEKANKRLRVVCISDTHGKHHAMLPKIPDGDILLHCGDFTTKLRDRDAESALADFNNFLGLLPHRHKVVIAGNHEIAFNNYTPDHIQRRLSNCYYLQDSGIVLEGLRIYGTPWTNSCNMGFSRRAPELDAVWARIPDNVDILMTHMPPFATHDLAYDPHSPKATIGTELCPACGKQHRRHAHWGSRGLRARVEVLRPPVHVFGHVHNSHGCEVREGTLFINAAQDMTEQPVFFDVYLASDGSGSSASDTTTVTLAPQPPMLLSLPASSMGGSSACANGAFSSSHEMLPPPPPPPGYSGSRGLAPAAAAAVAAAAAAAAAAARHALGFLPLRGRGAGGAQERERERGRQQTRERFPGGLQGEMSSPHWQERRDTGYSEGGRSSDSRRDDRSRSSTGRRGHFDSWASGSGDWGARGVGNVT